MNTDKSWNKNRLDELAADFNSVESRRKLMQEFGDYPDALWGENENAEKVMLSICKDGITARVFQKNQWVRVNEYDANGYMTGETYEDRWAERPKTDAAESDEELELSDEQTARNDEVYNAAYDFCKIMAEDENLEWNMEILGQLADFAADLLTGHGSKVRFPSVVTEPDGNQHIEEFYGEEG